MAAAAPSRELYHAIAGVLGLDGCWRARPHLDGGELLRRLGLSRGPLVGVYLEDQARWMLLHPAGTKEECAAHLEECKREREAEARRCAKEELEEADEVDEVLKVEEVKEIMVMECSSGGDGNEAEAGAANEEVCSPSATEAGKCRAKEEEVLEEEKCSSVRDIHRADVRVVNGEACTAERDMNGAEEQERKNEQTSSSKQNTKDIAVDREGCPSPMTAEGGKAAEVVNGEGSWPLVVVNGGEDGT